MSWRQLSEAPTKTPDEAQLIDVGDDQWSLRRWGKAIWAQLEDGLVLELPRLTKLDGSFEEAELAIAGTERLVGTPPSFYLLRGTVPVGIDDVTCGTYDLTWYDLENGRQWELQEVVLDGGEELFTPPEPITGPAALFVRRTSL